MGALAGLSGLSGISGEFGGGGGGGDTDYSFYYKFEDTSWADSAGNGAPSLSGTNSPTSSAGKLGNSLFVDLSSSQYLSHADDSAFDLSDTDFSLGCWVWADSLANFRALISKNAAGAEIDYYLFYGSGTWRFLIGDGSGVDFVDWTGTPSTGQWDWVLAERDKGAGEIRISVNNGTPDVVSSSRVVQNSPGAPFGIGARMIATPDAFWDGGIDSAFGIRRLLTPTEKTDIYNAGAGFDPV